MLFVYFYKKKVNMSILVDFLKIIIEPSKEKPPIKYVKKKCDKKPAGIYTCNYNAMSVNGYINILNYHNYINIVNSPKNNNKKWDIWFPDGYNNIDVKMEKIKLSNNDQIIFAIPGCDNIVSKYNAWKGLYDFYGRKKSSTIMPETFLLDKKRDISKINKLEGSMFILKKKIQRKQGLKITSNIKEIKNGYKNDYLISQRLIEPFLINKRKVNLRLYLMLTLQRGKLVGYFSNYGSCIYTKDEYDKKSKLFETNITSYKMDLDIYNNNPLTLEQLKTYLIDNNYDYDKLFEKIKQKICLFLIALKDQLGSSKFDKNLCAQVFGLDFIIDKELNPYLLEFNKGPEMRPKITTINEPEITDTILGNLSDLKKELSKKSDIDKIKSIKKYYNIIYKGYPKTLSNITILKNIENFYKNKNPYPSGYKTGNGIKVQKDSLLTLGIIKETTPNNGFEKIIEI